MCSIRWPARARLRTSGAVTPIGTLGEPGKTVPFPQQDQALKYWCMLRVCAQAKSWYLKWL